MSAHLTYDQIVGLCDWMRNVRDAQQETHVAYHYGSPCPYRVVAEIDEFNSDPRDLVAVWDIPIPGYDKPPLSLNDGRGGSVFAHAAKRDALKARVRNAVLLAGVPELTHVHVELHWRTKTRQKRDADNVVASLKYMIDALHHPDPAENTGWVPIVPGDDARYVSWSRPILHEPDKTLGPAIWLQLSSYLEPAYS